MTDFAIVPVVLHYEINQDYLADNYYKPLKRYVVIGKWLTINIEWNVDNK